MPEISFAGSSTTILVPLIQMLMSARELAEVREAIAHGTGLISRYDALSIYEQHEGRLVATSHQGETLAPSARAIEEMLSRAAASTGRTVSSLDRFDNEHDQSLADEYVARARLCLTRPLQAYGELVGALVLHYDGRTVLAEAEFDALRRFADCAGVVLASARTRDELNSYAYTDPLTGLANRRRLEVEFRRLVGSALSLLLIDFDGLKAVNDALGYDSGDRLVNAIGAALAALSLPNEFVVRLGGDEFVVVMSTAGREYASGRAEEVTRALDELSLPADLAALFHGASVGWATVDTAESPWDALRRAEVEMRSRKRRRKTDRELERDDGPNRPTNLRESA